MSKLDELLEQKKQIEAKIQSIKEQEYRDKLKQIAKFRESIPEEVKKWLLDKEEYIMDMNYTMVKVKYLDSSISKCDLIFAAYEPYEVNDYVVVNSGHHDFVVAQVTVVENVEGSVQYGREIICKVDMSAYEDRKARAKRRAELKGKMEAKVKELQETAIFEMLAKEDAGLAEMLKEFKELG